MHTPVAGTQGLPELVSRALLGMGVMLAVAVQLATVSNLIVVCSAMRKTGISSSYHQPYRLMLGQT